MSKPALQLLLALVVLSPASCGFLSGSNSSPPPTTPTTEILQFQSSGERLTLPWLQVGDKVYPKVVLQLRNNDSWSIASVGAPRTLGRDDAIQAVLTSPAEATISTDWRPADASITISRLHIDAKVYTNAVLRLSGDTWAWGRNLRELSAVNMADFAANASLVATESHHVVLQSAPENATQSFPLKLEAKSYKFCMDTQDDGADTLRLIDSTGAEVFSLKAGDPCAEIQPAAGVYTVQHTYGGTGTRRVVFVHPAAAAAATPAALASARVVTPIALAAQDPSYPEYWAVHDNNDASSRYMSVASGCAGNEILAIAGTSPYVLPGDTTTRTRYLFDAANFFGFATGADGLPNALGMPLSCGAGASAGTGSGSGLDTLYFSIDAGALDIASIFGPVVECAAPDPSSPVVGGPGGTAPDSSFGPRFGPAILASCRSGSGRTVVHIDGFASNAFDLVSDAGRLGTIAQGQTFYDLRTVLGVSTTPQRFNVGFRYFPNGLPPSMTLATGELAMFAGSNCSGAAMISEGVGLPYPQPAGPIDQLSILGSFTGSQQLGPLTTATVYSGYQYKGQSHVFNQTGCLDFNSAGFTPQSVAIGTNSVTIAIQTDSCEYCNLAGVDLQNLDLSRSIKLQHANLTDAKISNSNLSNADLRFATLQGAQLNYANLEAANLCQATLNAAKSGAAASLSGAHLKNANLSGADLDGAIFSYASFYSDAPQSCQSACDTYAKPVCASAYGASMDSANFSNAYLAGTDMGNTRANGAIFSGAMLFGTSFKNANLNRNAATGAATDFSFAFLQGADFTNSQVQSANFTSAYVEGDDSANCIQTDLNNEYTGFPGLLVANSAGACVAGTQRAPTCIQYVYGTAHRPMTDASNSCPNGAAGPCDATWTAPVTPIANSSHPNSSCTINPICDGFAVPLNTCW
ncbi:MAG: pentapeptide repeat-containing protein [Burkholderiales bacterium]|nr:pentapeptide repeat-containing protein [Burkholderiales bacterium]